MKYLIPVVCLFSFFTEVCAQPYGNEWINYSQKYFYFKIFQDNVYRISASTLSNAGFPATTTDHRSFQLFGRGKEIPLYIKDDGVQYILDGNDYIEFYAQKNDGYLDSLLYLNQQDQPSPYYSMFNDTATYYLTWNNTITNLRISYENASNFNDFTLFPFIINENIQSYTSTYFRGETVAGSDTDPEYTKAQGWFNSELNSGTSATKTFPTPNIYNSGPAAEFKTTIIGASKNESVNPDHHTRIDFKNSGGNFSYLIDKQFHGYDKIELLKTIAPSALHPVSTDFKYTVESGNRTTIAWASLKYPQTTNLNGNSSFLMVVPNHPSESKTFLEFSNFNASGDVHLYDITSGRKIKTYLQGSNYRVLIPNALGGGDKKCYLVSDNLVPYIPSIQGVSASANFVDFGTANADYVIITNTLLEGGATAYANYRKLKGLQTIVINIEELYHQFSHGIFKHPLSIKHFADFSLDKWSIKPQHLFIIGKSVNSVDSRKNSQNYANCLVPTFGSPSSDMLLTAGLNGAVYQAAIPTGRLAAKNNNEVLDYLNKMKAYEGYSAPEEWMKTILHFRGGGNSTEQNIFSGYMNNYKAIIEDTLFGGHVIDFHKNSSAPIDHTLANVIKYYVEQGVSLMTFFGHASGGGFDINIDDPKIYNNEGKYPVLLANSCFAGDIHQSTAASTSESFVLERNKGVIAFIANVGLGFPHILNTYSNSFYKNISSNHYGKSIGTAMQETVKSIQAPGNYYNKAACLLMTLHGDPALKINSFEKPDIMISKPQIFFTPVNITTEIDSFDVNVILTNLGHAFNNHFSLELSRKFPDGSVKNEIVSVNGLHFKDTIIFRLAVDHDKGPGENVISVYADNLSLINELNESNNKTITKLNISSSDILPVYPYHYAIVPDQNVTLKASTINSLAPARKYVLEIDTTDLYNSPIKERTEIMHSGGIVSWTPDLLQNMPDSMVYFWRASPDSTSSFGYKWRESSFQYVPGKNGWGQAHFSQYKNNDYDFIEYNKPDRLFKFKNTLKQLYCSNIGNPATSQERLSIAYKIDAEVQDYALCELIPSVHVVVIDPNTLEPWKSENYPQFFIHSHCRNSKYFIFRASSNSDMEAMVTMITDSVPTGHYIMAYSVIRPLCQQWAPATHNAFQSLGASPALLTNTDSIPFIFFVKKGDLSSSITILGDNPRSNINLTTIISRNLPDGSFNSTIAGPAKTWNSFHWKQNSLENPSTDSVSVDIIGIDINGNENPLLTIPETSTDITSLNINADLFPYLKLRANLKDENSKTPAQVKRWHLLFEEAPESALNASRHFYFYTDTVQEGDKIKFMIAIENIGKTDMDSMNVKYWIEDSNRKIIPLDYKKLSPLPADSSITTSIEFSTLGFPGHNSLWVEINPKDEKWQLEQYHFNNKAQLGYFVGRDHTNPLLDVTFDGLHILNGDIVSAKPFIVAQLKDENKFLALNDTSNFSVYLTDPDGQLKKLPFTFQGQELIKFIPASLPKNSCRIEYQPHLMKDGEYELRIQANDRSQNSSGDLAYVINFNVINKSTITEVLNFPNPFSTSTRFVFTLTGSVIPSHFKIQIMTISGKVVREIHKDELGPIRIGRNITEYAWDGRDEFGDALANGVYLYKVITRIDGKAIEHQETNADQFFHKEFGKMYLMR